MNTNQKLRLLATKVQVLRKKRAALRKELSLYQSQSPTKEAEVKKGKKGAAKRRKNKAQKQRLSGVKQGKRGRDKAQKKQPIPQPGKGKSTVPKNKVDYYYNDPTTPTLRNLVDVPAKDNSATYKYVVQGYNGGGTAYDSDAGRAAECQVSVRDSIALWRQAWPNSKADWPATKMLTVKPKAGNGRELNAYYDRKSLNFLWQPIPKMNKTVYASSSVDVVTHELGHALLDSVKPQLWNLVGLEHGAFHESHADINAMITVFSYPTVRAAVLSETKNDLHQTNVVSELAEELGAALRALGAGIPAGQPLRNAVSDYKYVDPTDLPDNGPYTSLTAEAHSFSRVFTSTWWDVMANVYDVMRDSMQAADAVVAAVATAKKYLYYAIQNAPTSTAYYAAIGDSMIQAASSMDHGSYADAVRQAFTGRNIPVGAGVTQMRRSLADELKGTVSYRLSDHVEGNNPLYQLEIEAPATSAPHLTNLRSFGRRVKLTAENETAHLKRALDHLYARRLVFGDGFPEPARQAAFEVREGKLSRFRFFCNCGCRH